MLYSDLRELKKVLEIDPDNTSEDTKLNFYIEQASRWIEDLLDRPGMTYKSRTEYYGGTGTQKLLLKSRPVYTSPAILVYLDSGGYFGSVTGSFNANTTALVYGTDFALKIDQEDGSSRSGILIRIDAFWEQPSIRESGFLSPHVSEAFGNIKVVYTGGYTVDTLPAVFRFACNLLIARMKYVLPLGMLLGSESYEERSISLLEDRKDYIMGPVRGLLLPYRNWTW